MTAGALLLGAALAWAAPPTADAKTVKTVKLLLTLPVEEIPPEAVEGFLAIDPETLPKGLRPKARARALELHTLKHIADGRKKGNWRVPGPDCTRPKEAGSLEAKLLKQAGYIPILKREKEHLEQRTRCTEKDLLCEFTLIIVAPKGPGRDPEYYLHHKDQLNAYIAEYRAGRRSQDTQFFGQTGPTCP